MRHPAFRCVALTKAGPSTSLGTTRNRCNVRVCPVHRARDAGNCFGTRTQNGLNGIDGDDGVNHSTSLRSVSVQSAGVRVPKLLRSARGRWLVERQTQSGRAGPSTSLGTTTQGCLYTRPPFITNTTRLSAVMSFVGSPSTAMMSASKPGAIVPIELPSPSDSAFNEVAERITDIGS
jgi:hypothetical protein